MILDNIVIRKSTSNELVQVKNLFEAMFTQKVFVHKPVFEEATSGEQVYVALLNEMIVGFASVWEPDHFIHFLFVSPAARRKRIGSTLISRLAAIYGVPLTLKCLIRNEDGMAFYRATGWQTIENGTSEDGAYTLLRYCDCEKRI